MNACVTFVIEREWGARFLRVWLSRVGSGGNRLLFAQKGNDVALMVVAAGGLRVQGLDQSLAPLEVPPPPVIGSYCQTSGT